MGIIGTRIYARGSSFKHPALLSGTLGTVRVLGWWTLDGGRADGAIRKVSIGVSRPPIGALIGSNPIAITIYIGNGLTMADRILTNFKTAPTGWNAIAHVMVMATLAKKDGAPITRIYEEPTMC